LVDVGKQEKAVVFMTRILAEPRCPFYGVLHSQPGAPWSLPHHDDWRSTRRRRDDVAPPVCSSSPDRPIARTKARAHVAQWVAVTKPNVKLRVELDPILTAQPMHPPSPPRLFHLG
jgi:hypothetical protein